MAAEVYSGASPTTGPRTRAAVRYAICDDLRYLSHHDELRMLARALVRGGWPLRYSEGFNPIPRMSLPLPRSVGVAADSQLALIELRGLEDAGELADRLAAALPPGCFLHEVLAPTAPGSPHPLVVEYVLELDAEAARSVAARVDRSLARERPGDDQPLPSDIRPYVTGLELDGTQLHLRLRYQAQRTARLGAVLAALGLDAETRPPRIRRAEVTWDLELAAPGARRAAPQGMKLGPTEEDQTKKTT